MPIPDRIGRDELSAGSFTTVSSADVLIDEFATRRCIDAHAHRLGVPCQVREYVPDRPTRKVRGHTHVRIRHPSDKIQAEGEGSSERIAEMAGICEEHGATFVYHVDDPDEGAMLIEVRRKAWPAWEQVGKALLPEDVAVPRERLAELLAGITEIGERRRVQLPTIGHAGDGNIHPLLVFDGDDPDETARAKAAFADIVALALDLGGTIAGEHGVGTLKRPFLEDELDPTQLAVQRRIRDVLDPHGRLNPGKAL